MIYYEFLHYYYYKEDALLFTILAVINGKSIKYKSSADKELTKEVMQLPKGDKMHG